VGIYFPPQLDVGDAREYVPDMSMRKGYFIKCDPTIMAVVRGLADEFNEPYSSLIERMLRAACEQVMRQALILQAESRVNPSPEAAAEAAYASALRSLDRFKAMFPSLPNDKMLRPVQSLAPMLQPIPIPTEVVAP
jgi:hypothetical protein